MSDTEILTLSEAHALAVSALCASRTAPDVAESVARALVAAEADGQAGHGLSRIPSYAAQARSGKVDGFARPVLVEATPALVRVDAGLGFAYPAFDLALAALPQPARKLGIAMAAVRRSHHFGQAGAHCEALAAQGLVAFVFGNAPKAIAPWGGRRPLFGTNPIAFAAPVAPGEPPLVIDLAVSRVAKGKIMAAEKAGRPIPEGWALDAEGRPTTDPAAAMAGTMIPIGEAKGAALALMIEVMAAAVVGASLAFEATSLFDAEGPAPDLGQLVLAIDPGLTSGGVFYERMAVLVAAIGAEEGARLPGSRRLEARARAAREGLAVPRPILREIRAIAGA
ncbi:Ldh family oxidoreductase [Microvirga tunisiensis]|uniref:Ldh family oxidoreductase n=2 Tax=Pannonibacter tanglangensis TaxID=2750084 RepID=A0A7X5F418_9HYPH|nr:MULTISPECIES: Ldh family oxidoreductase [unclassified Pannonibacter]NBN62715.1 Ldh family oxidoreductase [Pannonibacter sp. XCT-34]NBN78370.1 Ldh family oxidoreductase [Pannonibacter sp. XCT-53]